MKRGEVKERKAQLPCLKRVGEAVQLFVDGRPMLLTAGEVHNSASSCLKHMEGVYDRAASLNCNALFVPVTWEMVEPEEDRFDWSIVEGLLEGARRRNIRLIPLWFGTYKNSWSSYVPGWVKVDQKRFPRQQAHPGVNAGAVTVCCDEVRRLDARAYAGLMRQIRKIDARHRTVIMMQVENEVGMLGASRDHSELAERAFAGQVSAELMRYLQTHEQSLRPELSGPWTQAGRKNAGTWQDVFGVAADEVFMAWQYASFVETVAAAGKAEYDLPMYANPWLVQYPGQQPGHYPSGGPVAHMIDVWRAAAPSIALLAPDIYVEQFKFVCAEYTRGGNPLLIPEARREEAMAAKAFYAFGQHAAISFSPFGIESVGFKGAPVIDNVVAAGSWGQESSAEAAALLAESYRLIQDMTPLITTATAAGRSDGVLQTDNSPVMVELGGYRLLVEWARPFDAARCPGGGLILSPADGQFIIAGMGFTVRWLPPAGEPGSADFLGLWEGDYRNGQWVAGRRLNGDEYALRMGFTPCVMRAEVYVLP